MQRYTLFVLFTLCLVAVNAIQHQTAVDNTISPVPFFQSATTNGKDSYEFTDMPKSVQPLIDNPHDPIQAFTPAEALGSNLHVKPSYEDDTPPPKVNETEVELNQLADIKSHLQQVMELMNGRDKRLVNGANVNPDAEWKRLQALEKFVDEAGRQARLQQLAASKEENMKSQYHHFEEEAARITEKEPVSLSPSQLTYVWTQQPVIWKPDEASPGHLNEWADLLLFPLQAKVQSPEDRIKITPDMTPADVQRMVEAEFAKDEAAKKLDIDERSITEMMKQQSAPVKLTPIVAKSQQQQEQQQAKKAKQAEAAKPKPKPEEPKASEDGRVVVEAEQVPYMTADAHSFVELESNTIRQPTGGAGVQQGKIMEGTAASFQGPLPDLISFPGDGGMTVSCHTQGELRKYLDVVGIDHNEESGVNLYAVPVTLAGSETVDIPWGMGKVEHMGQITGFSYLFTTAHPDLDYNNRRCYAPSMIYEPTLEMVGPDSQEVKMGCTPFRVIARKLQSAAKCAQDLLGEQHWSSIQTDLLNQLAFEAQRRTPDKFQAVVSELIDRFFSEAQVDARTQANQRLVDLLSLRSDNINKPTLPQISTVTSDNRQIIKDCFKEQQRALICKPVLAGSVGMVNNGLTDHQPQWLRSATSIVKSCHVPEACPRLAIQSLMNFNFRRYTDVYAAVSNVTSLSWDNDCRPVNENWYSELGQANSRVLSSCMLKALSRLCKALPECCPTTPVHVACRKDVNSKRCSQVCINADATKFIGKDHPMHTTK